MSNPLSIPVSRRQTLATLGAGTAGLALAGPASAWQSPPKSDAQKLLDSIADNLIALSPEGATSLGIDTGDSAAMNIWLHKAVMRKLSENGGIVPDSLR